MAILFSRDDLSISITIDEENGFNKLFFNDIIVYNLNREEFELFAFFKVFELFSKNMLEFKNYNYLLCDFEIVRKDKHYYLKFSFLLREKKYTYYFDKLEAGVIAEMFNRYKRLTKPKL